MPLLAERLWRPACCRLLVGVRGLRLHGWLGVTVFMLGSIGSQAPTSLAMDLLSTARASLGGERRLAAVKTVTLAGQTRNRNLGARPGSSDRAFVIQRETINILFPDRFVRVADFVDLPFPSDRIGFVGPSVFSGAPDVEPYRETFGYLVLPLLLKTDSFFPFALLGSSEHSLQFRDPYGITATVTLDPVTNRPSRLNYEIRSRLQNGTLTGQRLAVTVEISDYRPVGDVLLPHVLNSFRESTLVTEERFDRISVNTPLDPAVFRR